MLCDGGLMTKLINPKSLCRFACGRYKKDCLYNATDTTTIFDKENSGINCDNIILNEHYGIDIPNTYTIFNEKEELGTFQHIKKINLKTNDVDEEYNIICYQPTWLNNCFVDQLTKLHYVELCYMYRGSVIIQTVGKKDILTTTGLKGLTASGLNVPESKMRSLADYYATYISNSTTLEEMEIFSRFGWSMDVMKFTIGNNSVSVDDIQKTYLTQDIAPETIDALAPVGSSGGWIDVTKGLLQHDNVRFTCYAVATSLLLKVLGGASFIVELVGDTSTGKTIAAQLAMSMFGNPQKLKLATSATKVFIERTCTTCCDLPIFLDETSMMQSDILSEISYMVANERSRGRGKKEGGVEAVSTWKTVLLTTGEVPLLSSGSLGGQEVRTVSLYGGIGKYDPQNVESFRDKMEENSGTIAPLLIQKILTYKNDLEQYYIDIRDELKEYSKADKTGVMGRVVDTYALISLSGFVFESVLEDCGCDTKDALQLVENKFKDKITHSDGSLPERAFSIITDWIIENRKNFCNDKEGYAGDRYDLYGNISMEFPDNEAPYDYVDIVPNKFYEVLDNKLDHPGISKRIIRDWNESGKIIVDKNGKNTILATIKTGTKQIRVIRLKMHLCIDEVI